MNESKQLAGREVCVWRDVQLGRRRERGGRIASDWDSVSEDGASAETRKSRAVKTEAQTASSAMC